jgi:hypothetical protein
MGGGGVKRAETGRVDPHFSKVRRILPQPLSVNKVHRIKSPLISNGRPTGQNIHELEFTEQAYVAVNF